MPDDQVGDYDYPVVWNIPSSPAAQKEVWLKEMHEMQFEALKERLNKLKEARPMKTLYQVIVVHNDKVAIDTKTVAKDVEDAKFKSGTYGWLINEGLTPGDVTIIVNVLGRVEANARS